MAVELDRGRESFGRRAWAGAFADLTAADRSEPLAPDDLERLAVAAHLLGRDDDSAEAWARAHHQWLEHGDVAGAARCALWSAFSLTFRGETARAGGWYARVRRLLEGLDECVVHGYLLAWDGLDHLFRGEPISAEPLFIQATELGERFGDPDLIVFGRLGRGQSLVYTGDTSRGVPLLDEVMVAVTADEVSPIFAGIFYCAVIETCHDIFDLGRAHEWTAALTEWCEQQPDLVAYRGQCLAHRAQIMRLHGEWNDALTEAQKACERLADHPALGDALYELAEVHRLRGHFAEAEEAYRRANECGRSSQPGLAQLRLAQRQTDAAAASIRHADEGTADRVAQPHQLAASIEILLAARDVTGARAAADQLANLAIDRDVPMLHAIASHATGAVLLEEGRATEALPVLRRAWAGWRSLGAPYEAARARVLVALTCRAVGDHDTAMMELDAARCVFEQLGAAPDVAGIDALTGAPPRPAPGGLTGREVEVLALVAGGKTNREVASHLHISEHTVARHVQNVFAKLGVSSRAAAVAFAVEHHLI